MPRTTCLLILVLPGWITNTSDAQSQTHTYPAPGYQFLGVYGGGDDRYFDYHLGKLSLGGSMTLSVGLRGEKPKWDVQTQGVHNGPLRLEVPAGELGSLQDFDVHLTLQSSSGVENGDKACATLSKLTIQAKGE